MPVIGMERNLLIGEQDIEPLLHVFAAEADLAVRVGQPADQAALGIALYIKDEVVLPLLDMSPEFPDFTQRFKRKGRFPPTLERNGNQPVNELVARQEFEEGLLNDPINPDVLIIRIRIISAEMIVASVCRR